MDNTITPADIERVARQDLAAANALWKELASTHSEPHVKPAVLQVGTIVANQYENTTYKRVGREYLAESGGEIYIKHAEAGNEYVGHVVGRTEKFLIQRESETGDYVLHKHKHLTGPALGYDEDAIKVKYLPLVGISEHANDGLTSQPAQHQSIGLVTPATPDTSLAMDKSRELER